MCTTSSLSVTKIKTFPPSLKIRYSVKTTAPLYLASLEILEDPNATCASGSVTPGTLLLPATPSIIVTKNEYQQAAALVANPQLELELKYNADYSLCCDGFSCEATQLGQALAVISAGVIEAVNELRSLNETATILLRAIHPAAQQLGTGRELRDSDVAPRQTG